MWTLISSIEFKRTRRHVGRVAVTTFIVVATATEAAMGFLATPAPAATTAVEVQIFRAGAVSTPADPALASAARFGLSR